MGARHWPTPKGFGTPALVLVALLVFGRSLFAPANTDIVLTQYANSLLLSGYTSHEERITEYLFNGEESHPMWV